VWWTEEALSSSAEEEVDGVSSEASALSARWTRERRGQVVHADSDEHVRLVLRTLGVDAETWAETLDVYADHVAPGASVAQRLSTLAEAFRRASRCAPPLTSGATSTCPACRAPALAPYIARRTTSEQPPIIYGRCGACDHGALLAGASSESVYCEPDYYRSRRPDGAGYAAYAAEQSYREGKGKSLLDWIQRSVVLPASPSLLEVGSGFGFTRRAAELRGYRTNGVDLNPFAAEAARERYGFATVTGTLESALSSGEIQRRAWDLVLYQFVLEHMNEPGPELLRAADALAPGGHLVIVVPNMATFELSVFGGAYRSLRADHYHLFSPASAAAYLRGARLHEVARKTSCSLHLLRGFLTQQELAELYRSDRGPDLFLIARSEP
jgi:SAM-dependent methyltransferase